MSTESITSTSTATASATIWHRRWKTMHAKYRSSEAENAALRAALDELNADVEGFLNIAHQAGHEEAKSHLIRVQMKSLRALRRRLRELEQAQEVSA